jgi:hypothetical protein
MFETLFGCQSILGVGSHERSDEIFRWFRDVLPVPRVTVIHHLVSRSIGRYELVAHNSRCARVHSSISSWVSDARKGV